MSVNVNVGENNNQEKCTTEQISDSLRSYSTGVACPKCSVVGATTVTPSWNIITCLVSYFCTECYCIWAMYKRKDWNCYNAEHKCSSCGTYIDTYNSCN